MKNFNKFRLLAKEKGEKYYFTGKPCKRGHLSKRWTKNGICLECNKFFQLRDRDKRLIGSKKRRIKKIYGCLTIEEYNKLLFDQNNVCKLCNKEFQNAKSTHIDHCHETNKIRGIIMF